MSTTKTIVETAVRKHVLKYGQTWPLADGTPCVSSPENPIEMYVSVFNGDHWVSFITPVDADAYKQQNCWYESYYYDSSRTVEDMLAFSVDADGFVDISKYDI